ncbi:MAG: NlpC/P60 family protein [Rhodocyclaceae bacterium]|jgi:cell wall-associated NlpC family hydrolase|nr:NlpC/P60 family protein [Rhodocyclaceae bacterium]
MRSKTLLQAALLALILSQPVAAEEPRPVRPSAAELVRKYTAQAQAATQSALDQALDLLGIRYRRGGTSPESGFDCSGFVGHVFREGLGLILPRSSKEISKTGEAVAKNELKPGDLVFFNTMRSAFSHVGIYLGDNLFVHAPRAGGQVRIEDMRESYWAKRYNGARRVSDES